MRLLQEDVRHFETLVQDTDTVCTHPDGLNKKRRFESELDQSPDTSEQPQPLKRSRNHTNRLDTPGTSCMDGPSAVGEGRPTYIRMGSPGSRAPTYHAANTGGPQITASDRQDATASDTPNFAYYPAANAKHSYTGNIVADGGGVGVKTVTAQQSLSHPQSVTDSPQQSQCARSQSKQPAECLQQPVLLDLQHEYGVVREHVSCKDTNSGLPAIASIAALGSCMFDLNNAAKMDSESWFLMVREKIQEELDRAGLTGLPTV